MKRSGAPNGLVWENGVFYIFNYLFVSQAGKMAHKVGALCDVI